MTIDAFAGRLRRVRRGSARAASASGPGRKRRATCAACCEGSTLADIAYHLVPRFRAWQPGSWDTPEQQALRFDIGWDWVPLDPAPRPRDVLRALPARSAAARSTSRRTATRCAASRRCTAPCAMRWRRRSACSTSSSTRSPTIRCVFPDCEGARIIEDQVISAGHFHGMPLALAMSYVKAAIPVLASISERRLNKLVDPATNDGLPALPDRQRGRHRVRLHDRAVHRRGDRQRPGQPRASGLGLFDPDQRQRRGPRVDGRERGAPRARRWPTTWARCSALELYTAAQALDYRRDMINAARDAGPATAMPRRWPAKVQGAPAAGQRRRAPSSWPKSKALRVELAEADEFHPGDAVAPRACRDPRGRSRSWHARPRAWTAKSPLAVRLVEEGTLLRPRRRRAAIGAAKAAPSGSQYVHAAGIGGRARGCGRRSWPSTARRRPGAAPRRR